MCPWKPLQLGGIQVVWTALIDFRVSCDGPTKSRNTSMYSNQHKRWWQAWHCEKCSESNCRCDVWKRRIPRTQITATSSFGRTSHITFEKISWDFYGSIQKSGSKELDEMVISFFHAKGIAFSVACMLAWDGTFGARIASDGPPRNLFTLTQTEKWLQILRMSKLWRC